MALSVLNPNVNQRAVSGLATSVARQLHRAKNAVSDRLAERSSAFAIESQEALFIKTRQVRCENDLAALEITLINNAYGPGVVVSEVGPGNALTAGILVGDVLSDINGQMVTSHEQAMETLRGVACRDFVFSFIGRPRAVVIDRHDTGRIEVTLTNPQKGPGVEVETVGVMGLAAAAGVRAGDVILAVNGRLCFDHAEAVAMIDTTERFIDLVLAPSDWDERV